MGDLNEGKHLYSLEANDIIHSMVFSPNRYWLCAATDTCIKIWDLESKSIVDELTPDFPPIGKKAMPHFCISLCWSADGSTLYSGYTDGNIRVWAVGLGPRVALLNFLERENSDLQKEVATLQSDIAA